MNMSHPLILFFYVTPTNIDAAKSDFPYGGINMIINNSYDELKCCFHVLESRLQNLVVLSVLAPDSLVKPLVPPQTQGPADMETIGDSCHWSHESPLALFMPTPHRPDDM
jgi:hypothetical protein